MRDILKDLSVSSPVRKVVFAKGSQITASTAGENWIGYIMDVCPAGIFCLLPTDDMAKRWSRQRLRPMIKGCPRLDGLATEADDTKTILQRDFPGGYLLIASAGSPSGLRQVTYRFGMFDELDAWDVDPNEGDPLERAYRGCRNFPNHKILEISTPLLLDSSRIWSEFETTDQRYYHVPCPHCGECQVLRWKRADGSYGIRWDGETLAEARASTRFVCEICSKEIFEHHKTAMLEGGTWVPSMPELVDRFVKGYHLSALYSPWYTWASCVEEFLKAKGSPEKLQVWVNQTLGECFQQEGQAPSWERLYNRREDYAVGTCPEGVGLLVAGADIQGNRIEVEVVGYGKGRESWSIAYEVLHGDPAKDEVWRDLDELLNRKFPHALGHELGIETMAVDSGDQTQRVYHWVRQRMQRVMAVKGRSTPTGMILSQPRAVDVTHQGRKIPRGVMLWMVGGHEAKKELYDSLRAEEPTHPEDDGYPLGWCHFPQYADEYFKMLCAERLVLRRNRRGYSIREWEQIRPRNEALDCRVYARAAAVRHGIDQWTDEDWDARIGVAPTRKKRKRREGFVDSWRVTPSSK